MITESDVDALKHVLSEFADIPIDDERVFVAAVGVLMEDRMRYGKPQDWLSRMEGVRRSAFAIKRVVDELPQKEAREFDRGIRGGAPGIRISAESTGLDLASALDVLDAIIASADQSIHIAENLADEYPAKQGAPGYRDSDIGCVVADFYVEFRRQEPPKAGANGPYQRLLTDVFAALGRRRMPDLRPILRRVHEYRNK